MSAAAHTSPALRWVEIVVAVALALAAHLLIASVLEPRAVTASGASGGSIAVPLAAPGEDLNALVNSWATEPNTQPVQDRAEPVPPTEIAINAPVNAVETLDPVTPSDLTPTPTPDPAERPDALNRPTAPNLTAPSVLLQAPLSDLGVQVARTLSPSPEAKAAPTEIAQQPPPEPATLPPQDVIALSSRPRPKPPVPEAFKARNKQAPRQVVQAPKPVEEVAVTRPAAPTPSAGAQGASAATVSGGGDPQVAAQPGAGETGLSQAERSSLLGAYAAEIIRAIAREKRYPQRARSRGVEGVARLSLTLERDGSVVAASIETSSGNRSLDDAALAALRRVGRFPEAPAKLPGQRFPFVIPIRFQME